MDKRVLRDFRGRSRTGCKTRHAKYQWRRKIAAGGSAQPCGVLSDRGGSFVSPKWVPQMAGSGRGAWRYPARRRGPLCGVDAEYCAAMRSGLPRRR